ncbi:DUF222 domain-containing protein [Williamsia sp. M5A3_1d]
MNDIQSDYAALEQIVDRILISDSASCTEEEVADLAIRNERITRKLEAAGNRRILDVSDRDAHRAVGCVNLAEFLRTKLRVTQLKKRLKEVQALEPMHAMTGEKLPPVCPNMARELAAGAIGADHVHAVLDVMGKIPTAVEPEHRAYAEQTLAEFATTLTPKEIAAAGVRILAHLDPDGRLTDDRDRARNRKLSLGCQDSQLMSKLTATLDPTTRALFDVVLAKWAAPGMNNPDDDKSPHGDGSEISSDVLREAADRECCSQSQRNHDAFKAVRFVRRPCHKVTSSVLRTEARCAFGVARSMSLCGTVGGSSTSPTPRRISRCSATSRMSPCSSAAPAASRPRHNG